MCFIIKESKTSILTAILLKEAIQQLSSFLMAGFKFKSINIRMMRTVTLIVPLPLQTQTKATKKSIMSTDLKIFQLNSENRLEMLLECLVTSILILEEMEASIMMILKKTLTLTIMTNMSLTLTMRGRRKSM